MTDTARDVAPNLAERAGADELCCTAADLLANQEARSVGGLGMKVLRPTMSAQ